MVRRGGHVVLDRLTFTVPRGQVPACSGRLVPVYLRLTADGGRMLKGQLALTATRPTQPVTGTGPTGDLALHQPTSESGHTQVYASGNAVDGDPNTYWESPDNAFPQWLQVDLGSTTAAARVVLTLPPSSAWAARTQTLTVQGSTDGSSFTTVAASANYTFDPATGNTATITFPGTVSTRCLRLVFTANTGWPAGQVSGFQVYSA